MSQEGGGTPPGWYHATGDPPATQRWWDGRQWVGGPVPVAAPPGRHVADRDALPELGRVLAGPWHRIAARLIDSLVSGVLALLISIPWLSSIDLQSFGEFSEFTVAVALLAFVYEVVFVALRGATPGKMAMGIAVIRQDGTFPPGWNAAVLRAVLPLIGIVPVIGFVSGLLELVSVVLLFVDERRRTIPDRIATTYVVRTR